MQKININGYIINGELSSDNAGNSVWGEAYKDGKKYFVKRLKETYYDIPYEKATDFQKEYIESSERFYYRICRLFLELKEADNGSLAVPLEFIKKDGHYYIITEWIDKAGDFSDVKNFTPALKHMLMKVLAYNIMGLASKNIVHCDLKPDNICIKETISGVKTFKIIDLDNSFITGDYPDMVGGSQNYMAPEVFIRMTQDEAGAEDKIDITHKADVFSLGIIFHEILTGTAPSIPDEYSYIGIAAGYGAEAKLSDELAEEYYSLISKMLSPEPEKRPHALEVFNTLRDTDPLKLSCRR
ncbi:MAG: protein kinase [Ruminococcus sp.]